MACRDSDEIAGPAEPGLLAMGVQKDFGRKARLGNALSIRSLEELGAIRAERYITVSGMLLSIVVAYVQMRILTTFRPVDSHAVSVRSILLPRGRYASSDCGSDIGRAHSRPFSL